MVDIFSSHNSFFFRTPGELPPPASGQSVKRVTLGLLRARSELVTF